MDTRKETALQSRSKNLKIPMILTALSVDHPACHTNNIRERILELANMRLAKSQPMLRPEERARLEEIKEMYENVELSDAEITALRLEYQHRLEAEAEIVREPG